jgi:hypothetical protein
MLRPIWTVAVSPGAATGQPGDPSAAAIAPVALGWTASPAQETAMLRSMAEMVIVRRGRAN